MASIAIIAPDGNRVVGFHADNPAELRRLVRSRSSLRGHPSVTVIESESTKGDWPFRFDLIVAPCGGRWRTFAPDDLPARLWLQG